MARKHGLWGCERLIADLNRAALCRAVQPVVGSKRHGGGGTRSSRVAIGGKACHYVDAARAGQVGRWGEGRWRRRWGGLRGRSRRVVRGCGWSGRGGWLPASDEGQRHQGDKRPPAQDSGRML